MFNWDLLVPYQYDDDYITLRDLQRIMLRDYHPEYVRRFIGWLHYKNGNVGAGGLARTEQPNKPGFAPSLYESFHWAGQVYNDGVKGACAVDTVFKDGPDPGTAHDGIAWTEVPMQGSAEAKRWGIHANVGVPGKGESWHLQPIEIDGHASWLRAGSPAPAHSYPIPPEHDPNAPITPPPVGGEDDMKPYIMIPPPERVGKPWLFVSASIRPANSFDLEDGIPTRDMKSIKGKNELTGELYRVEQYDDAFTAAGLNV